MNASKSKTKKEVAIKPRGKSEQERWYALARKLCSIIADRQKYNHRCKYCFTMKDYHNRYGYIKAPYRGCDGCAEMDNFFYECKKFFKEVK